MKSRGGGTDSEDLPQNLFSHDVSKGIITPLFAATASRAEHLNGKVSVHYMSSSSTVPACVDTMRRMRRVQLLGPDACATDVPASLSARGAAEAVWDWADAQAECFEAVADDEYEVMN